MSHLIMMGSSIDRTLAFQAGKSGLIPLPINYIFIFIIYIHETRRYNRFHSHRITTRDDTKGLMIRMNRGSRMYHRYRSLDSSECNETKEVKPKPNIYEKVYTSLRRILRSSSREQEIKLHTKTDGGRRIVQLREWVSHSLKWFYILTIYKMGAVKQPGPTRTTKEWKEIKISKMDDQHLMNSIALLEKWSREWYTQRTWWWMGPDTYRYDEETIVGTKVFIDYPYQELVAEAIKRKLYTEDQLFEKKVICTFLKFHL